MVVSPIVSAGANFALSADGNRLAVVNRGAIEIYDLPAACAACKWPAVRSSAGPNRQRLKRVDGSGSVLITEVRVQAARPSWRRQP